MSAFDWYDSSGTAIIDTPRSVPDLVDLDLDHDGNPICPNKSWFAPLTEGPYVYLIEQVGGPFVKVGFTGRSPRERLAELEKSTANPYILRLVGFIRGSRFLEAELHETLRDYRSPRGKEWFYREPALALLTSDEGWEAAGV